MLHHTVLLPGYPAAKGPRETTGEMLGNAEGAGGCPTRALELPHPWPGMRPRWLQSPALALAQPWHWPSPAGSHGGVLSNPMSPLMMSAPCRGGQDSSAPGAVTPPAPQRAARGNPQ